MLKFCYDNESDIPDYARPHYKKGTDGKWYLEIEGGVVPKVKLDEFRNTNSTLMIEIRDLKTKFEGIDPAEYQRLKDTEADLEAGKLKGTKLEAILEKRTEEMKRAHSAEVQKITGERDLKSKELERLKIGEAATTAGVKMGLRPTAATDLAQRVQSQFKLNDKGEVRAYNEKGQEIFGANAEPLTIEEFVAGLTKTADHLFMPSDGTGADNSGTKKGGELGNLNPWKAETWNLTLQGDIYKKEPARARALAKAAGKPIPE